MTPQHHLPADIERTSMRIITEELARRDMDYQPISQENYDELVSRMDDYINEFEAHGTDNILVDSPELGD